MRFTPTTALGFAMLWPLLASGCRSQESAPVYDGRNLYLGYCAACHGETGAGDGPVAPSLNVVMQDLRTLANRHGQFPSDWVREVIDGRTLRAVHGTPDMPVWGWRFRLEETSAAAADARIDALVTYLRSFQQE